MSAISISAPGYSGVSLTSGFRRRRLSWYVPSLVCHLFPQFSMNASTSDFATASLSDSAINSFLKSKTNPTFSVHKGGKGVLAKQSFGPYPVTRVTDDEVPALLELISEKRNNAPSRICLRIYTMTTIMVWQEILLWTASSTNMCVSQVKHSGHWCVVIGSGWVFSRKAPTPGRGQRWLLHHLIVPPHRPSPHDQSSHALHRRLFLHERVYWRVSLAWKFI